MSSSTENPYAFTNLVDLVLSKNRSSRPESFPIYIDSVTDQSISYGDFKKLIRQATAGLQNIGLKRGDCVCVYSPNDISVPSTFLSILAAGGHISPANPLFNVKELKGLLQLGKAKYIIAHPFNLDVALEAAAQVGIPVSNVWSIQKDPKNRAPFWKDKVVKENEESSPVKLTLEQSKNSLAYLCFSSGTTGPPKGVKISHYNFIASTFELDKSMSQSNLYHEFGNLLAIVPLFHIMGLFRFVHLSVYEGRTTILMPQYDLEKMCAMIQKHRITTLYAVPPILIHLLNSPHIVNKYDISSLKTMHVGAAPVSLAVSNAIKETFHVPVYQGYGMTESASVLTAQYEETYAPGSVGRMIGGIETKVIDENGKDLKRGETGEICIRGPIVMMGYIDNPQATAETIDKNGFLHTGDIGYEDELGNWFIVDRCKELIKYNAYQIAPAELEDVLLKCPLVADAAVIGIYDPKRQTEVPRAYVTLSPEGKQNDHAITEIHAFVNSQVIHYKQLRGGIELIDSVPKSPTGKILRKDLRTLYKKSMSKL